MRAWWRLRRFLPVMLARTGRLETPAGASKVYLSPHHDDIGFSLGGFAGAHPGGVLINAFTRSGWAGGAQAVGDGEIARVSAMRAAEDSAFAEAVGLRRIDLGLDDAPLRGYRSDDLSGLDAEIAALDGLAERLLRLADELPAPRLLFVPMAIGPHLNHLAVRDTVLAHFDVLSAKYEMLFYEDLPYAAHATVRLTGIKDLMKRLRPRRPLRMVFEIEPGAVDAKLRLLRLYPSQHQMLPETLENFSPKLPRKSGPHEAAWRFVQPIYPRVTGAG